MGESCTKQVRWGGDGEGSTGCFLSSYLLYFLLAGWVLLSDSSVSQTESPCPYPSFIPVDRLSGGVVEGVVNVEQDR